jgi:hypothetical protein
MTRTQVQFPDELYERVKTIAANKELTFAEVVRRGMEKYTATFPKKFEPEWEFPELPEGYEMVAELPTLNPEAEAIEYRSMK